eukprot:2510083-Pyramimonas_sp.AAC.1
MSPSALIDLPALISFDFGQAFPSLSRQWLHRVLGSMNVPDPLRALDCGIIRGCPASGTLFAMATDCFFTDMEAALSRHSAGIARACADD